MSFWSCSERSTTCNARVQICIWRERATAVLINRMRIVGRTTLRLNRIHTLYIHYNKHEAPLSPNIIQSDAESVIELDPRWSCGCCWWCCWWRWWWWIWWSRTGAQLCCAYAVRSEREHIDGDSVQNCIMFFNLFISSQCHRQQNWPKRGVWP